ncbi:MAG: hypothetical protein KatS3mg064_0311 [Tepidiforma sp.]|nr:hypothetical protein [Tepidiforma sp.]GIW17154.1 MAG: hypothetical protein KatS3mg064_0311 [Tepidiforma sp.]
MSDQSVTPLGTAGPPADRTDAPPPNRMPTSPPDGDSGSESNVPDPNSWQLVGPDGQPPQNVSDAGTSTHTPPGLDPVPSSAGSTSSRPQQSQGASETAVAADLAAANEANAHAAGTDEGGQPTPSSAEGGVSVSSTPNHVPPPIAGGITPDSSYNPPPAEGSGAAILPETPRPPAQQSTPVYDVRPIPDEVRSMDIDGDGRPDLPASAGGPPGAPSAMPEVPPAQGGTSTPPGLSGIFPNPSEGPAEDYEGLRLAAEQAARADEVGDYIGAIGPGTTFPLPPAEHPVAPGEQPPQTAPIDDRIRNLEPGEGGRPGIVYDPPFPDAPRTLPGDLPRGETPAPPPAETEEPPAPPRNGEAEHPPANGEQPGYRPPPAYEQPGDQPPTNGMQPGYQDQPPPPVDEQPGDQDQPPPPAYERPGYQDQPPPVDEQPGYQDQPPPAYEQPGDQDQPPPAYDQPGYQDQPPPPVAEQPGYQDQPPPPVDEQPGYQDQPPPPVAEQPGYQDQPPPAYEQPGYQDQPPPPVAEQPGYQDQPPPPVDEQPGYQDQPSPPVDEQPGYQDQPPPPVAEQPGYQDQPPPAYEQPGYQDQPPPPVDEQPGYQDQPSPPVDEQPGYQDQPPPPADEQPGYQDQPPPAYEQPGDQPPTGDVAGEVAPDPADSAAPVPVASAPSGPSLDVFDTSGAGASAPDSGSGGSAGEPAPVTLPPEPPAPPTEAPWTLTRDDAIAPPPQAAAAATPSLEPVVFEVPLPADGLASDGSGIQEFDPDVARLIAWVRAAVADAAVMGEDAPLADEERGGGNILERILDWIRDALFQGGDEPSDADIAAQIQVLDAEEVAELYRQSLAMAAPAEDDDLDD